MAKICRHRIGSKERVKKRSDRVCRMSSETLDSGLVFV